MTPKKYVYLTTIVCEQCGKEATTRKRGPRLTARFCSNSCAGRWKMAQPEIRQKVIEGVQKPLVEKTCEWCGTVFTRRSQGENTAKRRFCNRRCSALWRTSQPHIIDAFAQNVVGKYPGANKGCKNPAASVRMKLYMSDPANVKKMRRGLIGRTFLARGGNGTLTPQQIMVATALAAPTEYVIATLNVRDQFPSLPPCYKVDVALPAYHLAIEIDGRSHRAKLWRFLDARKTEVLAALGWRVIRFSNERVMADLDGVLAEIHAAAADAPTTP